MKRGRRSTNSSTRLNSLSVTTKSLGPARSANWTTPSRSDRGELRAKVCPHRYRCPARPPRPPTAHEPAARQPARGRGTSSAQDAAHQQPTYRNQEQPALGVGGEIADADGDKRDGQQDQRQDGGAVTPEAAQETTAGDDNQQGRRQRERGRVTTDEGQGRAEISLELVEQVAQGRQPGGGTCHAVDRPAEMADHSQGRLLHALGKEPCLG